MVSIPCWFSFRGTVGRFFFMSRKCPTHKIPCAMRLLAFPWDCGTFPPFFLICAGGKYFLPQKRIVFSRARIVGIGESPTVPQVPQNAQSIWKQGLFSVGLSGGTIFKVPRTLLSWPSKGQFIIVVTPLSIIRRQTQPDAIYCHTVDALCLCIALASCVDQTLGL